MGVLLQAFYWNCPQLEGQQGLWWNFITPRIPNLAAKGFTALWLPPANKAANIGGMSMGYDPYDYFDLGDINQKGSTKTWFGNQAELLELIKAAHESKMQVYADIVINHNNGADGQEANPLDGISRWTKFTPGSGKFPRDYESFHPSPYERWDGQTFGDMPDLCHRNPDVYIAMVEYIRWLIETIGFDGLRFDFVKGYGAWMVRALMEERYLKGGDGFSPFGVGECWDSDRTIADWLAQANNWSDNPICAFDFPLKWRLNDLCQKYGFSLRELTQGGTALSEEPDRAVTFVENHDTETNGPCTRNKMLGYAYILTHEGYPCVFWRDYFNYGLAQEGHQSGIAALVAVHEANAGGTTTVLYVDDNLYVMQRSGADGKPGLVLVLNSRGDGWNGTWVQTQWNNTKLTPVAWRGENDSNNPAAQVTQGNGYVQLWAPPQGYAVYVPS